MMNFFKSLLEPVTNGSEVADLTMRLIRAKISKTTIKKEIEEHPDYPGLLSISDIFTSHGIENIALEIDADQLAETSDPFIVQLYVRKEVTFFSVVKEIRNNTVNYFDPEKHDWVLSSRDDFAKKITGVILLIGKGDEICEKDYDKKIKAENRKRILRYAGIFCIPILTVALGIFYCFQNGSAMFFPLIYLLFTIIGCGLGILLAWYELDQHNPALNQICTAGKRINCGAVLQSKASRIAGLSWSSIGMSYFTGLLLLLVFSGLDNKDVLFILSWISILTIPYLIFSVYYQWTIAKQWCVLCLSVLGVLVLQIIISAFAGWHTISPINSLTAGRVMQILVAFIFPLIIINVLITALQKVKAGKENFTSLQKLKNNPHVFSALLKKQKEVPEPLENLGIILGNPKAKYRIIKVCNPYCGPCSAAHQQMEELLQFNEDLRLQILFTATNEKNDIRTPPIKHFLALADKYDEETLKQALDDWYLNDPKNYDAFAARYPVDDELEHQDRKIELMKNWCDKIKIEYTPTFFISMDEGHEDRPSTYFQMPGTYTANDLKYLFLNK